MVALLPADHALAGRDSLSLSDLCHEPFVLTEAGSSELVSRLFSAARLTPNIRYRCSQLISTLDTVGRGDALTVVAEGSLPDDNDNRYVKKTAVATGQPTGRAGGARSASVITCDAGLYQTGLKSE